MNDLFLSSTGVGIKLRIKSFVALLVPVINELLKSQGINLIPDQFNIFIDAAFIVVFGVLQAWGWMRAKRSG